MDAQADADFLALPSRAQRTVDRAFDRGARTGSGSRRRTTRGRAAKRRKVDAATTGTGASSAATPMDEDEGGGGFIVDDEMGGGGFIPDDEDGAGGFIPDDDDAGGGFMVDDNNAGGGGFLPDDDDSPGGFINDDSEPGPSRSRGTRARHPASASVTPARGGTNAVTGADSDERVPLHAIPALLASLGLSADEDVMGVFRASAEGWAEEGEGGGASAGVTRRDFRAVCAALMPDDASGDGDEGGDDADEDDDDEDGEDNDNESFSDNSTDAFQPSDDGSDDGPSGGGNYNEDDDGDDGNYGTRSKGKAKKGTKTPRRTRRTVLEEVPVAKLSTAQRALARELWDMLKPPAGAPGGGTGGGHGLSSASSFILGRDEVKRWAREMGEMWSDEEITDMVALFSSQHEGRGLSFDDFGAVMLRAGLV